jgi:hypothetical protein
VLLYSSNILQSHKLLCPLSPPLEYEFQYAGQLAIIKKLRQKRKDGCLTFDFLFLPSSVPQTFNKSENKILVSDTVDGWV